jgi:PAS domain S-box-containing protein
MANREKKILIVEDSKSTNKILTQYFLHKKYTVFSVFTLAEAYDCLSIESIGYILLDMNLPDGNGYELLKSYSNKGIKFFVFTSDTDAQLKEISYQNGVIDFIVKDKDFYKKISQIDENITLLEKNKNKKIIIIDDSVVITSQLKDIFENRNYKVFTATTTGKALEIFHSTKIDLVILDLELKETNGITFLNEQATSIFLYGKIPVIILTGNIKPSTTRDALKVGAVEVMKKPYVIEEMILKVDIWINYHRQSQELHFSNKLLAQYKSAIDESTIISKTDKRGIITYVNKKFCEISGYSEAELIGKSHNIVRHPDMDKDIFTFVWYTIKDLKQTWNGVIKNKKKDGSPY